jgi:hypothetical protein
MHTFEQIIDEMPHLLEDLNSKPMFKKGDIITRKDLVPQKGIYVLFENNRPMYVGRSDNIRQRLGGHCNQGSDRFSATFAFRLAIREYEGRYGKSTKGIRRQDLESNQDFQIIFKESKFRVSQMGIKIVEIADPLIQTIFEVYAAMNLGTLEFNSFDNH